MKVERIGGEQIVGWGAAICWLAAWFLPVIVDYTGWDAFVAVLTGPFREKFRTPGEDAVPQVLSALTNVAFMVLFAHWLRRAITRPALFLKIAIACVLLNLYWPVQMLRSGEYSGLGAGYYAWLMAFALLMTLGVISVVSARRTSKTPTGDTPA